MTNSGFSSSASFPGQRPVSREIGSLPESRLPRPQAATGRDVSLVSASSHANTLVDRVSKGSFCIIAGTIIASRSNPWAWMAVAFCASLAFAITLLAVFGAQGRGVSYALAGTARLAFLFFWPAYVGGALTSLFGNLFLPLRDNARNFGLAFAGALLVHLGLVVRLCAIGHPPGAKTFVVFGTAAAWVYILMLLSVRRVRDALSDKFWTSVRSLAMSYIALVFIFDFAKFPDDLSHGVEYAPFATLAALGPALKVAAWIKPPSQKKFITRRQII